MVPIYIWRRDTPDTQGRMPCKVRDKLLELSADTLLCSPGTQPWQCLVIVALGKRNSSKRSSRGKCACLCQDWQHKEARSERSLNSRQVGLCPLTVDRTEAHRGVCNCTVGLVVGLGLRTLCGF